MASAYTPPTEQEIATWVRAMRTVAVVGMKGTHNAGEPAYTVPRRMQGMGMRVVPINPKLTESLGEKAYPTLAAAIAAAGTFDTVDVFRRAENVPALVDEILALPAASRPRVVWLQSGIVHDASAERLAQAGVKVVMDRCLGVDAARFR